MVSFLRVVASAFSPEPKDAAPMSHDEHVADHVVEIAARRMHDRDPGTCRKINSQR
jgi:hypothetical protein